MNALKEKVVVYEPRKTLAIIHLLANRHFNTFACWVTVKQMVCIKMGYIRLYVLDCVRELVCDYKKTPTLLILFASNVCSLSSVTYNRIGPRWKLKQLLLLFLKYHRRSRLWCTKDKEFASQTLWLWNVCWIRLYSSSEKIA